MRGRARGARLPRPDCRGDPVLGRAPAATRWGPGGRGPPCCCAGRLSEAAIALPLSVIDAASITVRGTLTFRRDHERLFAEGDYVPLEAAGARKDHVCA